MFLVLNQTSHIVSAQNFGKLIRLIRRIDDCIDKIGCAKYVTQFDLLKGYWQDPLTERAK